MMRWFAALQVVSASAVRWGDSSQWHVPEYCSTPGQMAQRGIEPLPARDAAQFELLQVQAVIRHGARVPYMQMYCWEGEQPYTCELNTVVAAQSGAAGEVDLRRVYRKVRCRPAGRCAFALLTALPLVLAPPPRLATPTAL